MEECNFHESALFSYLADLCLYSVVQAMEIVVLEFEPQGNILSAGTMDMLKNKSIYENEN